MPELRDEIKQAIVAASKGKLRETAIELFRVLGYSSERSLELGGSSPEAFLQFVDSHAGASNFNRDKALADDWKSADLLFQLTDEDLSRQRSLFEDHDIRPGLMRSYLFFAIELKGGNYARGKLTDIARQINRVFPMPVMLLIKHKTDKNQVLSIAVINRRLNKRDAAKDVLGKVTIIRDISVAAPHRGHLDILASFALDQLGHPQRLPIDSFDALHAAWEEIFNVELLNKRFYRELANWYFWALPQVEFPDDVEKDDERRRATSLIRLLTRLIFCWFLKEKGLIPEKLFNATDLTAILNELKPASCSYHQGILQNLFFGTLNQRMGKDKKGNSYRKFALDEGIKRNRSTYGVDNLFRYEEQFRDPDTAIDHFADIPFLNGGLFECLDRTEPKTKKKIYIDGFSRNKKKRPHVPNELFFAEEISGVDLSDAYGERTRRNEKVRGLLRILNSYKFTIVENTPIDQEIALDPELLGKVFENLLASYNEETKSTARKQTGSFYTPRPIVEYMVDQSLKAHLHSALVESGLSEQQSDEGLETLFDYTEQPHPFSDRQVDLLLDAIHTCKILDPACGSGAFPMGMLQKLVYIIHKLDPDNAKWMQLQIDKADEIPDSSARKSAIKAIEQDFADNEDDYGRKLYLIENCLYGVDIQPIAIQISKLRFFISLVCDQKTNRRKKDNHGIRPLPNLETKFVAANTLVSLQKDAQKLLYETAKIRRLETDLQRVRHDHFAATTRQKKLSLQDQDREIRDKLASELKNTSFWDQSTALKLAAWNPFDPQSSADYFEPLWMFDPSLGEGFDVVIGNPPYFKENDDKKRFNGFRSLECYQGKMDVWYLFADVGINFLKQNGILAFIATNNWITNAGASKIRNKILQKTVLLSLLDFRDFMIFESASIQTMVMVLQKNEQPDAYETRISRANPGFSRTDISLLKSDRINAIENLQTFDFPINRAELLDQPILFKTSDIASITKLISQGTKLNLTKNEISQGIAPNPDRINSRNIKLLGDDTAKQRRVQIGDGVFTLSPEEQKAIAKSEKKYLKPLYEPTQVEKYFLRSSERKIIYSKRGSFIPSEAPTIIEHLTKFREVMEARRENKKGSIEYFNLHWPRDEANFTGGGKILSPRKCAYPTFLYVEEPAYVMLSMNVLRTSRLDMRFLSAVLNSSTIFFWLKHEGSMQGLNFQIDAGPLMRIPIATPESATQSLVGKLVEQVIFTLKASAGVSTSTSQFLEDLIDACVMECYFREHMAERGLLFLDDLAPHLEKFDADARDAKQSKVLEDLYRTLNAPDSPIRNRLLRLTADSPDLLAIIKQESQL